MYAGEPFHPAMLARFMEVMPRTRVANIYGPTETNIVTCYWVEQPPTVPVPIGREVDDTEIIVVDGDRRCAPGEVGEIWVRGGTVCIGYLGQPALTAARLVASPFHSFPTRFWRTGDLGTRLPDGNLAYFGRVDDMVKTRGYRVEIGDVEAALASAPEVSQAVVLHAPHPKYGATLHAFVLLVEGARAAPPELLAYAGQRLPTYMVPVDLHILDRFPHTSTGKVDRQQLRREWLVERA
jgi:acyl-CoA synthetase (AMP-forming)/AMP-acid ligase II